MMFIKTQESYLNGIFNFPLFVLKPKSLISAKLLSGTWHYHFALGMILENPAINLIGLEYNRLFLNN